MASTSSTPSPPHPIPKVELASSFILRQLEEKRRGAEDKEGENENEPLFVGIQGPQGSGKSHLLRDLFSHLTTAPLLSTSSSLSPSTSYRPLRVASFSLDDLYLPHDRLLGLTRVDNGNARHPNPMWKGRGPPGTHDLDLASQIFQELKRINGKNEDVNNPSPKTVNLPIYDKSLHSGQGDRSQEVVEVRGPVDVVIFEGWMVGFGPVSDEEIKQKWEEARQPSASSEPLSSPVTLASQGTITSSTSKLNHHLGKPFFSQHSLQHLLEINQALKGYCEKLWNFLECLIVLEPEGGLEWVWEWRLEQEHAMKAKNGGKGMTDEEVMNFIARYLPSYELFSRGLTEGWDLTLITTSRAPSSISSSNSKCFSATATSMDDRDAINNNTNPPWKGKGIKVVIGKARDLRKSVEF